MATKKKQTKSKHLKASEIGTYLYCKRAWFYSRKGEESANQEQMIQGTKLHEEHGRKALQAGCAQFFAYTLLTIAIILILFWLLQGLFQ